MERLCAELIVWRDNLPVELERSRSKKKEDCTEVKLYSKYFYKGHIYKVVGNPKIKTESGEWVDGILYQRADSISNLDKSEQEFLAQTYIRTKEQFADKFQELEIKGSIG